jgi:hypothetical protein
MSSVYPILKFHNPAIQYERHAIVPLLDAFKAQKQPLELIFPRKGALDSQAQRMDRCGTEYSAFDGIAKW